MRTREEVWLIALRSRRYTRMLPFISKRLLLKIDLKGIDITSK